MYTLKEAPTTTRARTRVFWSCVAHRLLAAHSSRQLFLGRRVLACGVHTSLTPSHLHAGASWGGSEHALLSAWGTCCFSSLGFRLISFIKHGSCAWLGLRWELSSRQPVSSSLSTWPGCWAPLGSGCEVWYFYWPLREAMPFLKGVA